MVQESVNKLFKQIYNDYGDEYNFDLDDIKKYYSKFDLDIELNKPILKNKNKINDYKFIKKVKIPFKKVKEKKDITIDNPNKCQARTWGNAYMDTKHYRKYMDTPRKLDPTKIGKKCTRDIAYGNIYCLQHLHKNTHGNFFIIPPDNKMGEYIHHNRHHILI